MTSDLAHSVHILTATGNLVLAKRWTAGPGGTSTCRGYDQAMHFTSREEPVESINALGRLLARLERDRQSCVIRAALLEGVDPATPHRRLLHARPDEDDGAQTCEDVARCWACFDVDDVPMPPGLSLPENPDEVIAAVIERHLPRDLHGVTCAWQLSSSAGMPKAAGIVKAHVWYYLARPLSSAELTRWAKAAGLKGVIDFATLRGVQPEYTAVPIFDGVEDPLPRRSGMLRRDRDVARLVPPLETARKAPTSRAVPSGVRPGDDALAEAAGLLRASWPAEGTGYHDAVAALCGALLAAGWTQDEVLVLVDAAVPTRSTPRPTEIPELVASTSAAIAAGRATTGWTRLAELVGAAVAEARELLGLEPRPVPPPPGGEGNDPDALIRELETALRRARRAAKAKRAPAVDPDFDVAEVVILESDPPTYRLKTSEGELTLGPSELGSAARFKRRFMEQLRRIPRVPVKADQWDAIVNGWLSRATVEELSPEASRDGYVESLVADVLRGLAQGEASSETDLRRGLLVAHAVDGRDLVLVMLLSLLSRVRAREVSASSTEVARALRALGWTPKVVRLPRTATTTRCWAAKASTCARTREASCFETEGQNETKQRNTETDLLSDGFAETIHG